MRVLHLSNIAGRAGGGVSEVVQSLVLHQNKKSNQSDLWFMGRKKIINEIKNDFEINKENLLSIPQFLNINNTISPGFFKKLNFVRNNYKIIHQHGVFLPISIFNLLTGNGCKKIVSTHGYLEPEKMKNSSLKKRIVLFLYERKNLNNADCLIASSRQEGVYLRDLGFKQPIAILPNGISDSFLTQKTLKSNVFDFKNKYDIEKNKKILLFLSRVHPWKGLVLFLNSLSKIKNHFLKKKWIFIIAGPDQLNHKNQLLEIVKKKNLNEIVRFIEPQYGDDKLKILDASDCMILPTKGENFGISIIEALARKIPVITTKNTPWKILNTNKCGWWIKREEKKIISTLSELLELNHDDLKIMGKNGFNLIKNKYTWTKINSQSESIYKWVINDFDNSYKINFEII